MRFVIFLYFFIFLIVAITAVFVAYSYGQDKAWGDCFDMHMEERQQQDR